MKHTKHVRTFIVRSLMVLGGVLGLFIVRALMFSGLAAPFMVPAAATSHDDAATTWTANFQAVNSTPVPPKEWNITLSVGCRGAASQTELARGATLDVSCTVDSQFAYLAYTVTWRPTNPRGRDHVEEYDGSAWHSCEQDETAKVTFTAVGRAPLNPAVTRSTECVDPSDIDDGPA